MKEILQGVIVAFSMYSKIPMPQFQWTEKNMKYCMCFFPLIGAVIAALMYGWWYLSSYMSWNENLVTAGLVLIPVAVTGGIHLDGLLDTSDALSSWKTREERLEIMKDSHAGAFAVIACACYFCAAFGIFSGADAHTLVLIGPGFILSRALSGLALVTFPKAKNSGLARTFADSAANRVVAVTMGVYILMVAAALVCLDLRKGCLQIVLSLLTFLWYYSMSKRVFGGITGDLAGFFLQICELVMAAGVILFF